MLTTEQIVKEIEKRIKELGDEMNSIDVEIACLEDRICLELLDCMRWGDPLTVDKKYGKDLLVFAERRSKCSALDEVRSMLAELAYKIANGIEEEEEQDA